VRRVQLDWNLIRGWFLRRSREESTETMGALLQRKQQVKTTLASPRGERPAMPVAPPTRTSSASPKPAEPPPADVAQSTTERLLARKRKRGADDSPGDAREP
jgi:hypothetical protein